MLFSILVLQLLEIAAVFALVAWGSRDLHRAGSVQVRFVGPFYHVWLLACVDRADMCLEIANGRLVQKRNTELRPQ